MESYRIFTISSGDVSEGARVEKFTLAGAGVEIPAILVGEEGRGRELGVLPVELLPEQQKIWQEKGEVEIHFAAVGRTESGRVRLFQKEESTTEEKILGVFPTKIGFRGGNDHTGEKYLIPCPNRGKKVTANYWCPECKLALVEVGNSEAFWAGVIHPEDKGEKPMWEPFPGEVISRGYIAQGEAGRSGGGEQLVALLPKNSVFRTEYFGRLYGAAPSHYYKWDGKKLTSLTFRERQILEAIEENEEVTWL